MGNISITIFSISLACNIWCGSPQSLFYFVPHTLELVWPVVVAHVWPAPTRSSCPKKQTLSDKHFLCGHASPKRFQQLFRCLCISSTSLVIPSMVTCSFRFSLCRRLTYLLSFAMLLCIYTKTVLTVYNILKPFHVCSPHQKQYLHTSKGRNVSLLKTKFFLFCQTF